MPDLHEDEPYTPRGHVAALAETDDRLMFLLQVAGNEWGPLGVALTAALMTDPDAVVQSLVVAGSAQPIGRKRLRAILAGRESIGRVEVVEDEHGVHAVSVEDTPARETEEDRLRRQLASVIAERDRVRDARVEVEAERDDARRQVVEQGEAAEEQADALRSEVARLSGLLDAQQQATVNLREHLDSERARAERAEGLVEGRLSHPPVELSVYGAGTVTCDGGRLQVVYEPAVAAQAILDEHDAREEASPHPIAEDPRRPRLDHFPEDAILLTYREVRQLLGLHLEACATAVDAGDAARAMREGETPLRLAEVLDR